MGVLSLIISLYFAPLGYFLPQSVVCVLCAANYVWQDDDSLRITVAIISGIAAAYGLFKAIVLFLDTFKEVESEYGEGKETSSITALMICVFCTAFLAVFLLLILRG